MKTSKGIPCNETRHTIKAEKNRINYRFVTEDSNTPSSCTIQLGDTDPLSGETITDMIFFKEYYRMEDHDIYSYWKTLRPYLPPAEKKHREEKKAKIIADFEKRYGYRLSESDLRWLTDDFIAERTTVSIERYRDEENNPERPDRIPVREQRPDHPFRMHHPARGHGSHDRRTDHGHHNHA